MAKFRITGPDGAVYEIDAPNDAAADSAVQQMFGATQPGPQTMATADGTQIPVPAGADPKTTMNAFVTGAFDAPEAPPEPTTVGSMASGAANYAAQTGAVGARGARRGAAALLGLPVDLANLGLGALGADTSGSPVMGSQWLDEVLGAPARATGQALQAAGVQNVPDADIGAEPEDPFQRVIQRIGYELGASALPTGAALALGPAMGVQTARTMARGVPAVAEASSVPGVQAVRQFGNDAASAVRSTAGRALETAAVDPVGAAGRAATAAVAAGTGAGVANEVAGNPQIGEGNFWSDLLGSVLGVSGAGALGQAGSSIGSLISALRGNADDLVRGEVADRLMNNSTELGAQKAATGTVDTAPVVSQLRRPSAAEEVVPGFQANIGDRSQDPGLATFAYNQDAAMPGAANSRRASNETAINERMRGLAPTGNAAEFRAGVQGSVDQRLAASQREVEQAQTRFDEAMARLQPNERMAEGRGSAIREGVQNAERAAREVEHAAYRGIEGNVDPIPFQEAFDGVTNGLTMAEQQAIGDLNATLGIPHQLAGVDRPASIQEMTTLRSRLTTAQRNANRGPQPDSNRARVIGRYIDALDSTLEGAGVDEGTLAQLRNARDISRQVNERFNRPGDPLALTAAEREGRPFVGDSAVPGKFVQPDTGQVSNMDRLFAETDLSSRGASTRQAVRDEILANLPREQPGEIGRYLQRYSGAFDRFPGLRDEVQQAAQLGQGAQAARATGQQLERDLTTPGRSPEASYLRYSDDRTVDAVRTAINAPDPRAATRQLIRAAGGNVENARAAFWTEIEQGGRLSAAGVTGEQRWSGRKLNDLLNDPKRSAVLEELYADNPEQLDDIATVFDALAKSESSIRAKAAGTSGTAQGRGAVTGKFDPALSTSSIASRVRSVHRSQMSPAIAGIDLLSTYLRRRALQARTRAIDTLASAVVNNPGLAADLLEQFNPADYAAKRRQLFQKYGTRATQVLNLLDEAQGPQDDTMDAINGDDR